MNSNLDTGFIWKEGNEYEQKIHQLRMDFQVTPEIKRYVYVCLIEGDFCYLVDSGVCGT